MIFVTVGTHEQPFNRLIEYVDNLKGSSIIDEEVVMQIGFSTYEPKYCTWEKLFPYRQMIEYVNEARIVITHGGPSSFIMPLQVGKTPIVVPRQKQFNEHVNNHQLEFAKQVETRQKNIIVIENIEDLKDTILNYDKLVCENTSELKSNNTVFNEKFEEIVNELLKERK